MKKIYYLLVNMGKILFIWTVLLVVSLSLYALRIRGKVSYGNRCYQNFDDELIKDYLYLGTTLTNSYLACNTYYLEYESSLNEQDNLLFLSSLTKLLMDNKITSNMHVIIQSEEYQLLATIVDYKISYTKSLI